MNLPVLVSAREIEVEVSDILKQSNCLGVFPTPVERILNFTELKLVDASELANIHSRYVTGSPDILRRALQKVNGVLDRPEKLVYISPNQLPTRQNFVKLHEIGHHVLPWQRHMYKCIEDDETTVSSETKDQFEQEANYFASSALFQLDYFDEHIVKLPLDIDTPKKLAKKFGASNHATLRRYVLRSSKRCALLVLKNPSYSNSSCAVRDYFQSQSFTNEFGVITWAETLNFEWSFVRDYLSGRKFYRNGTLELVSEHGECLNLDYHYFNNTWNAFILIKPAGEV